MSAPQAPVSQSEPPTPLAEPTRPGENDEPGVDAPTEATRPVLTTNVSDPPGMQDFAAATQQHGVTPAEHHEVKETLDARVEYTSDEEDGRTYHKINQYTIIEEIGRGSYGSVHLANDQFGNEYAVKEFSKSRLRKRALSQNLRKGPQGRPRKPPKRVKNDDGSPLTPQAGGEHPGEEKDALYLIREEVAIMKKARHPNLVALIEVLDDPEEDSLYMVLEMCKKGVAMKVGLDDHADPYSDDICRSYFRDLVLAIEYLHSQSIIHRDIKPDNLLVSEDDVLKVVDFGVSEMFEKPEGMKIKKSAGSPAFLPPELCGKHEGVSGTAADIWSMGVCLYCFRYGKIPFNRPGILEMYEAIKQDDPQLPEDEDASFSDLITRLLDKNPETRITMPEIREHAWITSDGADNLLPKEENCANTIEPPNELELNRAFTRKVDSLLSVFKAISRFKSLVTNSGDGEESDDKNAEKDQKDTKKDDDGDDDQKSDDSFDPAEEKARAQEIEALLERRRKILQKKDSGSSTDEVGKGHAQEIDQEPLHLGIGVGSRDAFDRDEATPDEVADSPSAVDFNIYDRAYEDAIKERLKKDPSERPIMYLTKFVKETDYFKTLENIVEGTIFSPNAIREQMHDAKEHLSEQFSSPPHNTLANLVSRIALSDPAKDVKPADIDSKMLKSSIMAADTGSNPKAGSLIERMKLSGLMAGKTAGEGTDKEAKPDIEVKAPEAKP